MTRTRCEAQTLQVGDVIEIPYQIPRANRAPGQRFEARMLRVMGIAPALPGMWAAKCSIVTKDLESGRVRTHTWDRLRKVTKISQEPGEGG